VTDAIARSVQLFNDFPWPCVFDHNLSNAASLFVRFDSWQKLCRLAGMKEGQVADC
jgi:hypothetical protein